MAEFAGDQCPERAAGLTHTKEDDGDLCEYCLQHLTFETPYYGQVQEQAQDVLVVAVEIALEAIEIDEEIAEPIDPDHETDGMRAARERAFLESLGRRARARLDFMKWLYQNRREVIQ